MAEGLEARLDRAGTLALAVALRVPPGQTLALVGPSGAGKSSVLKAIAGLVPAQGMVRVDGQAWLDGAASVPAWRRPVGLVMQDGALFPHLDGVHNVMIAQARPDRAAALALLADMQIDAATASRRPAGLSGGEQMRVALARALARQPALLLLDEPFAAIDRPVRRMLAQLVAKVRASSSAPMVMVTHDLDDAAALADRIAFIEGGQLVEEGPTATVLGDADSRLNRWLAGS